VPSERPARVTRGPKRGARYRVAHRMRTVGFKVTEAEYRELRRRAGLGRLNVSRYCRAVLLAGASAETPPGSAAR
jgi:hypothetical protein